MRPFATPTPSPPRPRPPIGPKTVPVQSSNKWVPFGKSIAVHGLTIPGGIYVGVSLKAATGMEDPCLINPQLPISSRSIAQNIEGYWPSYATLNQQCRRNYLDWLAAGRKNPSIDIGYVFLYFYGLERRAILDASMDASVLGEYPLIAQELHRLLGIYAPRSKSFNKYASRLLEWVTFTSERKTYLPANLPNIARSLSKVKLALGQASLDAAPVPAKLMLAWVKTDTATFALRTPATRCATQFDAVFETRYREKFSSGLVIGKSQAKLVFLYTPASAGFSQAAAISMGFKDIIDVGSIQKLVAIVQSLVEDATTAIEPFSRHIARNPQGNTELEGLVLLPPYLWPASMRSALHTIKRGVLKHPVSMTCSELLKSLGADNHLSKERIIALAHSLSSLGIGMEPDVQTTQKIPRSDETLVLFDLPKTPDPSRDDAAYQTGLLTIQLACAVASVDGHFSNEEYDYLQRRVLIWHHLAGNHTKRLLAHLQLRRHQPLKLATLTKHLASIEPNDKASIVALVAKLVHSDGRVSPKEMQLVSKIHAALGLEPPAMKVQSTVKVAPKKDTNTTVRKTFSLDANKIAKLQALPSDPTGMLRTIESMQDSIDEDVYDDSLNGLEELALDAPHKTSTPPLHPAPKTMEPKAPRVKLDATKIAALQKDTQTVDLLLASIFVHEHDPVPAPAIVETPAPSMAPVSPAQKDVPVSTSKVLFATLDQAHNSFAGQLMAKATWTREEANALAAQLDLMLDGALESLNDASFDAFDAPFAEGEDPIEINPDIRNTTNDHNESSQR